jgi:trehalose transport system permease protein
LLQPAITSTVIILRIDAFRIFVHPLALGVVIPLALPGIAVATIFAWLCSWDEVTYAIYLPLANRTLPLEIVNIVGRSPPPVIATYATLVTIPVLIVTYFLLRYLKADYLAGAIKG